MSDQQHISGPCSYCGAPDHWRPDCKELHKDTKAIQEHRKDQEPAKQPANTAGEKYVCIYCLKEYPDAASSMACCPEQQPACPKCAEMEKQVKELQGYLNLYQASDEIVSKDLDKWTKERDDLKAKCAELEKQKAQLCRDWAEDHTAMQTLCRPIIGDFAVDGDSYGVPSLTDMAEKAVSALKAKCEALEKALNGTLPLLRHYRELLSSMEAFKSERETALAIEIAKAALAGGKPTSD